MSLDVSLIIYTPAVKKEDDIIFIREDGRTKQITPEEWVERMGEVQPIIFSKPTEDESTNEVYTSNITHNLGKMAKEAGIYEALWRPEEIGKTKASDIIPLLTAGLSDLKARPEHFKQFNPENGWGKYEGLVEFVEEYLQACTEYPDATILIST